MRISTYLEKRFSKKPAVKPVEEKDPASVFVSLRYNGIVDESKASVVIKAINRGQIVRDLKLIAVKKSLLASLALSFVSNTDIYTLKWLKSLEISNDLYETTYINSFYIESQQPGCKRIFNQIASGTYLEPPPKADPNAGDCEASKKYLAKLKAAQALIDPASALDEDDKQDHFGRVTSHLLPNGRIFWSGYAGNYCGAEIDRGSRVLIQYSAAWNRPSQTIAPFITTMRHCYDFIFVEIDIDQFPDLADVSVLPTFRMFTFKDGHELTSCTKDLGMTLRRTITGTDKFAIELMCYTFCPSRIAKRRSPFDPVEDDK